METVNIITLIVSGITLLVCLTTSILTYRLEKHKKKIERLEKFYTIAIGNLQACYEIEEFYAEKLQKTRKQVQIEIGEWLEERNVELNRKYYSPSFLKNELTYLGK